MTKIIKVVSGGQTGADRGALDAAISLGVGHGGWCPRGRRAEDGRVPDVYDLTETPEAGYVQRTALNVRDSSATLILHTGLMGPGSQATSRTARQAGRPWLVVDIARPLALSAALGWLRDMITPVLNVAGSRESGSPGIQVASREFVSSLLKELGHGP